MRARARMLIKLINFSLPTDSNHVLTTAGPPSAAAMARSYHGRRETAVN
jgi:hypothetical protein